MDLKQHCQTLLSWYFKLPADCGNETLNNLEKKHYVQFIVELMEQGYAEWIDVIGSLRESACAVNKSIKH